MTDQTERPYPYAEVIARIRAERWSQRQDSTIEQLADLIPVANALGLQDAVYFMQRFVSTQRFAEKGESR